MNGNYREWIYRNWIGTAIQPCCGGYAAMLPRLYSHVVEAIQPCCRGYTVILRMLRSHVAEIYSLVSNVVINSYSLIYTKTCEK
jgi:hypothetical protein